MSICARFILTESVVRQMGRFMIMTVELLLIIVFDVDNTIIGPNPVSLVAFSDFSMSLPR